MYMLEVKRRLQGYVHLIDKLFSAQLTKAVLLAMVGFEEGKRATESQ